MGHVGCYGYPYGTPICYHAFGSSLWLLWQLPRSAGEGAYLTAQSPIDRIDSSRQQIHTVNSMVPTRFENATRLRDSGDPEAAATEFHLLVEEVSSPEEKVALLINEHRCWCDSGHLDQADIVLDQIRRLNTTDP